MIGKFDRRSAAVLAADVAGYGRLIAEDPEGTLTALQLIVRGLVKPAIRAVGGRLVKTNGDGILVELPDAMAAITCAVAMQRSFAKRNQQLAERRRIRVRMGVACGEVFGAGTDIFGETVILAARLQELAEPGGICVPRAVIDDVGGEPDLPFQALGPRLLKNWPRPVEVFTARPEAGAISPRAA